MMATKRIGDKYEFSSADVLGRGSYATVYKGRDIATGAVVAVKVIEIGKFPPESRERKYLLQEIDIMKQIDHPNLIKMFHAQVRFLKRW
jgi:negative regulator of PHO system